MTTSPTPAEAPVTAPTGSTVASSASTPATTGLSDERAASIGWFFITSYYDFYNSNIENIHRIYHQQASVSHSQFPSDDESEDAKIIHRAQGLDAIKARFQNDSKLANTNRIVITSAAFEVSLSKNILIVVFGEWSRENSPYYQFTQTFLLTPGKKENTFDVANDVLRFVDFSEFKEDTESAKEKEVVEEKVEEKEKEEKKERIEEKVEERAEEAEEKAEEKVEEKTEKEPEEVVAVDAEEPKGETEEEESKPSQPLSWAALASQAAPPKAASKAVPVPSVPKTAPPPAKKPVASLPNGKFKKEEWFPIYIRGIKEINEKHLKDHIAKKFGELKFFKTSLNIALCDFVALDAQKKALEAKETVIDNTTIFLEPRESKTGNNYHATNKKFKDQKDKPVEIKRNKSEKKPAPKKPNRPVARKE